MVPLLFLLRLRYLLVIVLVSLNTFLFSSYFGNVGYGFINVQWAWPFIIGFIISAKRQIMVAVPLLIAMPIITFYDIHSFADSLSWLNVALTIVICLASLNFDIKLPKTMIKIFNFLGTISYPIYVCHLPLLMLLYHWGISDVYFLVGLVILITIPLNYIFDDYLKKIFWKPLIEFLEVQLLRLNSKKSKTIVNA
jgi:peptidoglycan/LPS O-acetylase OafA/YrhL